MAKTKDAELEAMLEGATTNGADPFADEAPPAPLDEEPIEFDFSEPEPLREGVYHAKVLTSATGISQAGNRKIDLKLQVPEIGRTMQTQISLAPGARWKSGDELRALGVTPGVDGRMGLFKPSDLAGKLCRVKIKNDTYEGKTIPKVDMILPPEEFGATENLFKEL